MMRVLWWVWQFTWCLPQNLVGLVLYLLHRKNEHLPFQCSIVTAWEHRGCTSMGSFLFLDRRALRHRPLLVHEYGHTMQSAVLGWLYLPVIALPSMLWYSLPAARKWRRKKHYSYYRFYTEAWANRWGERACREPSMGKAFID